MSFTAYATAIAGSVLTATFWNQQVRDNGTAIRAGGIAMAGQTAGDLLYAASPTQFGRLPSMGRNYTVRGGAPPSMLQNIGWQSMWLPAHSFQSQKSGLGGPTPFVEIGASPNAGITGMSFPPSATLAAGTTFVMPKAWDLGTLSGRIYWTIQGSSAGVCCWYVNVCQTFGDGENINTYSTYGSGSVFDSAPGSLVLRISPAFNFSLGTTVGYLRWCRILMWRNSQAENTLGEAAIFLGLRITYNTTSYCDS